MSESGLVLKRASGWFAAGAEFTAAVLELSDAAFKLYAWVCLNADRRTGQLSTTVAALTSALHKPASWTELALGELLTSEVCRWVAMEVLEVSDHYWPYEKRRRDGTPDYVSEVRRMLLEPACVKSQFSPADEHLARKLGESGVTLEQVQRAIWLGCARKYVSMLNGSAKLPITSLRYFLGLVEEVQQSNIASTYWSHVQRKAAELERRWTQQQLDPASRVG